MLNSPFQVAASTSAAADIAAAAAAAAYYLILNNKSLTKGEKTRFTPHDDRSPTTSHVSPA